MNLFDYIRPATLDEAAEAGAGPGAAYLGAGTNLLDLMKVGAMRPSRIVDLTRIPGLSAIEDTPDGGLRIGALVRNADVSADPRIRARFPAVAEALLSGASAQLRNAATVGGNLMQHTRCPYFADPESPCNRRAPGTGCAALGGETRMMAVLGASDQCIATHPSDFCVPLVALDAVVEVLGPSGRRELPLEEVHLLPGDTPQVVTALAPGEIVTALRLPGASAAFAANARYVKLRDRTSYAFALVSAAAALRIENGRIVEARLALGGVAAKPWRARGAEAVLTGAAPEADTFAEAAEAALAMAAPIGDNDFKITLARRVLVRALARAAAGTPEHLPALPASAFASQGGTAHV
ncbi:FAD binding domain-containing protein [Salipiger sp.]|uniref:FAD binding domain-containing protein n=1 Tax=Salipiger sp. TaxID=2078585 RepID=UPI003A97DAD0